MKSEGIYIVTRKLTGVTLNLTLEEAGYLRKVCGQIGGDPDTTPRGFFTKLANHLDSLGVKKTGEISDSDGTGIFFEKF
jgi:hypothetical protein